MVWLFAAAFLGAVFGMLFSSAETKYARFGNGLTAIGLVFSLGALVGSFYEIKVVSLPAHHLVDCCVFFLTSLTVSFLILYKVFSPDRREPKQR